jgi:hypothetical protein
MNRLTSCNDLCSLFVNVLLNFAYIFSAGFSSGLNAGKKIRTIFLGIINRLAL